MEQLSQLYDETPHGNLVLKKLIGLHAENEALKRMFVNYLLSNFPEHTKVELNSSYLKYYQEALDTIKDISVGYSKEISDHVYSELKDIPGIKLFDL